MFWILASLIQKGCWPCLWGTKELAHMQVNQELACILLLTDTYYSTNWMFCVQKSIGRNSSLLIFKKPYQQLLRHLNILFLWVFLKHLVALLLHWSILDNNSEARQQLRSFYRYEIQVLSSCHVLCHSHWSSACFVPGPIQDVLKWCTAWKNNIKTTILSVLRV